MRDKTCNFWLDRRLFFGLLRAMLIPAVLWVVFVLVERSDRAILEHRSKYRLICAWEVNSTNGASADEQRIANRFVADTLPGLMQKGLVKQYLRHESGTVLLVSGKAWKKRSSFFKDSLLTEVLTYNKVNGFSSWTRIIDNESRKLYAQISFFRKIEFYD